MNTVGPNLGVLINGNKGEEHYSQLMRQWRALDGLVQPVVLTLGGTVPPASNADGDMHIVGVGAGGDWAGMDNRFARYFTVGVGAPAWEFYVPRSGWIARTLDSLDGSGLPRTAEFSGSAWALVESGGSSEVPVVELTDGSYELNSVHNGVYLRMTASGESTVTIRLQAIHPLPDNGVWHIWNAGDSDMTVIPSGVMVNLPAGGSYVVPVGGIITLKRIAVDTFDLMGQTTGSGGGGSVSASDFEANVAYITYTDSDDKVLLSLNEGSLAVALGLDDKLDVSEVGLSVASLVGGLVPNVQLPSYVDDVLEYANYAAFPATGESAKIYVSLAAGTDGSGAFAANQQFRWSGSVYQRIVASPGTTDNVPEGSTNQYHTPARVRASTLAGFVAAVASFTITAADTVLSAFQKIQGRLNQLGTAATADVTTSTTDTTAGRVMKVGDAGWLGVNTPATMDANALNVSGAYQLNIGAPGDFLNFPTWAVPSRSTVLTMGNKAPYSTDLYFDRTLGRAAFRVWNTTAGSWHEFWHTGNTSANVQTLLASADNSAIRSNIGLGSAATRPLISSYTDNTVNSVLTTGYGGIGRYSDLRTTVFATGLPSDIFGRGTMFGFATGGELGISGLSGTSYGALTINGQYSDISGTTGINRSFQFGAKHFLQAAATGSSWGPWVESWTTGNTSADVQAMLGAANNAAIRSAIGVGTGTGTVTSVSMSVPTGLTVTGSPITSSGTFAVTLTAGYAIPTTANQTNWSTAFTQTRQWNGGSTGLVPATGRTSLELGNLATLTGSADVLSMLGAANNAAIRSAIGAGTGNGSVTSVGMSTPTGLTVAGSPLTGSGTLAVTFTAGYSIPTTAKQTQWDTAYTDRNNWDGGSTGLVAATGRASLGAAKRTVVANDSSTSYDVTSTDEDVYRRMTNAGAKVVNVRPNTTHALPTDGAWLFKNMGAGNLTITPGSGVTINPPYGGTLVVPQGAAVTLQKVGTNEYDLIGQTVAA